MKKTIIKVIIGIIAVPTVVLGTLYATREIPVVSNNIITPLAGIAKSIGIPVIVKPKYSDDVIRQHISVLKENYYVSKFECQGNYPNKIA